MRRHAIHMFYIFNQHDPLSRSISFQAHQMHDNNMPEAEVHVAAAAEKEDVAQPTVELKPIVPAEIEIYENTVQPESGEKASLVKTDSAEKSSSSNHKNPEMNSSVTDTSKDHQHKSKEAPKVREKRSPPLKPKHKPDGPLSNAIDDTKKSSVDEVKVPMPKPVTALRSASVRPVSARPSAPRRRDRNVKQILNHDSFIHEPIERKKSAKKDLISEFDDGENIIITDIIQDTTSATNDAIALDKIADGKQGHLVQQILETQTVFMNADNDAKNGEKIVR